MWPLTVFCESPLVLQHFTLVDQPLFIHWDFNRGSDVLFKLLHGPLREKELEICDSKKDCH